MTRNNELDLEDAYHNWQEAVYMNGDQDTIDSLEKTYEEIFTEVSNQSDFWSHGLRV